jgi:hypothetical protein
VLRCTSAFCDLKIFLVAGKVTGVTSLAEMLLISANSDQLVGGNTVSMLGIQSTCMQHDRFCTGANKQIFADDFCRNAYRTLPRLSSTCGVAAVLSGNTITCRAKHQFMVQIDPDTHCKHLGMNYEVCNDQKCDYPGNAEDVNPEYRNLNPALTAALLKINEVLLEEKMLNKWEYAVYCPIQKMFVRLEVPGQQYIQLTEVQIVGGSVVAVTASSTADGRSPSNLGNGVIKGNYNDGDLCHTSQFYQDNSE